MARPLRIAYPGALYHVFVRGNNRQNIFSSDEDRWHFLRVLANTITRFDWVCYAYCLMSNHFHLLIKTCQPTISEGMKFLNGTFTQYFNWKHDRVGHLFQGRFKSPVVQESAYFRRLCCYIVMNPVEAGMCAYPGDYQWSSFNATVGRVPAPEFLTVFPVLEQWGNNLNEARQEYERYVLESPSDKPLNEMKSQLYLGNEQFLHEIREHLPEKVFQELIRNNAPPVRQTLPKLLELPNGLLIANAQEGYSRNELANYMGVSSRTISRLMKDQRDV